MVKPTWEVLDLSQNMFRMPIRTLSYSPFMVITFGTESDFPAAMFKNFSLRKMSKAWWPLLGPKFWKVPLRPARSNDIFVLVSHAKTYASPP